MQLEQHIVGDVAIVTVFDSYDSEAEALASVRGEAA